MDSQALLVNPLSLLLAAAGMFSFASPCVLPLLPAYLAYMTGMTSEEIATRQDAAARGHILGRSTAFVVGLSLVFTALGASASALGQVLFQHQTVLGRLAGLTVVVFGLQQLGLIQIPLLYQEKRLTFGAQRGGYLGATLLGAAFATGWTPCVGPFLAGLLALASQEQTVGQGMLLLFVYSLVKDQVTLAGMIR